MVYELRREVFPTLNKIKKYAESPRMMTLDSFFLLMMGYQNININYSFRGNY